VYVLRQLFEQEAHVVWHREPKLDNVDAVVLPGGFAHGDYLRCGAIARFSPIMDSVREHVARGKPLLGICNGMQVLTEAGLLPGALLRNSSSEYRCKWVHLRVENADPLFLRHGRSGQIIRLPISHGEGRYHCDTEQLAEMDQAGQVLLRYSTAIGEIDEQSNPNGAMQGIAGIRNKQGTVFGLMPHPERACEPLLGGADGRCIFQSMIEAMHA
jgi:phosphoribosylformylglycinamidine synthase I